MMDDILSELEYDNNSNSIVMGVLRSAMDKAHEKLQSKDGPIEFLHERSKFYELSAILVEAGLNIVQEEADILESSRETIRLDLMEIEHWLQGRIKQMRVLIVDKDRELRERFENEARLKQALEKKERELVYLREKLEVEKSKSESFQDEAEAGDFYELKNSLDQQVLNIKQKLEDERRSLDIGTRDLTGIDHLDLINELSDEEKHRSPQYGKSDLHGEVQSFGTESVRPEPNIVLQQMSSDIDILMGTLNFAFGRMQKAEVLPLEKQWRRTIKKDIMSILIGGLMEDIHLSVEAELMGRENKSLVGFSKENCNELMIELMNLHQELQGLLSRIERQLKSNDSIKSCGLPQVRRTTSEPLPDPDDERPEDAEANGSTNYVAKMIQTHESIIRKKQQEEWKWLTSEVIRGRGSASHKLDAGGLERSLHESIARLDHFLKLNHHMEGSYFFNGGKYASGTRALNSCGATSEMDCCKNCREEMNNLREERDYQSMQIWLTEEINHLVLQGLKKDADNQKLDGKASEINCSSNLEEEIMNLREERDYQRMQLWLIGEINHLLLQGLKEEIDLEMCSLASRENVARNDNRILPLRQDGCSHGYISADVKLNKVDGESEGSSFCEVLQKYLEGIIREDVYMTLFHEMIKESSERMRYCTDEYLVREEAYHNVPNQANEDNVGSEILNISQLNSKIRDPSLDMDKFRCCSLSSDAIKSLLKEDVYAVYFKELARSWESEIDAYHLENLIRDDLYQVVMLEVVKDGYFLLGEVEAADGKNLSEKASSSAREDFDRGDTYTELDFLSTYELEKVLQLKGGTEMNEYQTSCEEMHVLYNMVSVATDNVNKSSSDDEKLDWNPEQFHPIKGSFTGLKDSLVISADESEKEELHDQMNDEENKCGRQYSRIDNSQTEQKKSPFANPVLVLPVEFQQVLINFERITQEKFDRSCLRVEELNQQLATLVPLVNSLRKDKSLYKKAFLARCRNLSLAEAEVDLLGDQVDRLLDLLEKMFVVLNDNSTALAQYFEVSDLLISIKKELSCGVAETIQY